MPHDPQLRARIDVSVRQKRTNGGIFSPTPTLSVHMVIPDNSDVFKAIQQGSLKRLINLFKQGKACLRDCDPNGCSLLNVCTFISLDENISG